jgi:hypothetical protein
MRLLAACFSLFLTSALAAPPQLSRISDNAFSGSSINVVANIRQSVCTHDDRQFAAYYDADGYMVLAARSLKPNTNNAWEIVRTPHRGNVADAHNSISLIVDGAGFLHVSWDHHGNPLNYARSVAPGSLELGPKISMTGERESRVTYPQFFAHPSGDLLFLYRDGRSGQGSLVLNRYDVATQTWRTVQPNLIDGEAKRSPYWAMTVDARGSLHLAWNWRESPDVATNQDLAYARSDDVGETWIQIDGTPQALPITAANGGYAARIPQNSNLMNPPFITTDARQRPYLLSYWSPASGYPPQFQIVHHDGKAWRQILGPTPRNTFTLAGGGTKRPPISRGLLLVSDERLHLVYRDDSRDSRIVLATRSLNNASTWSEDLITENSVGAWEPSYDSGAWQKHRQLHMLVQHAEQRDGNDRSAAQTPPADISVLTWTP